MNKAQIILFSAISALILLAVLVVLGVIPGIRRQASDKVTLTVWGFEDEAVWRELAERYRESFSNVTVSYARKNPETYEQDLLNALAAGSGPDVFVLSNRQIVEHGDKLQPLPEKEIPFGPRDFKSTFFDAAAKDLITAEGKIIGIPLALDTLALFYNRDQLNSANVPAPPATWDELTDTVKKLTAYTEVGTVSRSGIALGTASNIAHATDIVSALMVQSGVELVLRDTKTSGLAAGRPPPGVEGPAESALNFYTSFADAGRRTYSWSSFFPNSMDAFARGQTAMIIGYASDIPRIVEKNPHLNFDVARFPQLKDAPIKIYYGRYQFEAVSRQSQNADEAWRFILWLSEKENVKAFADAVALAPSRRDLMGEQPPKDYLEIFYGQALAARTWLVPDEDLINDLFTEMVTSVVNKTADAGTAAGRAHTRLNNLLNSPL